MNNLYNDVYHILAAKFGTMNWWPIVIGQTAHYGDGYSQKERTAQDILEIAIGAILTQNTNWKNVVIAIHNLKQAKLLNIKALAQIETPKLAALIRPSGYYNQKAKKIKYFIGFVQRELSGKLENLKSKANPRKLVLQIWGIGEETADSILLYGYNLPFFVVDAYCKRLFLRLGGLKSGQNYCEIQAIFQENLPKDTYIYKEYHALIVEICKLSCRVKPLCATCILQKSCKAAASFIK